MYIHLGQDVLVKNEEIIGVFDLDNATVSKRTRDYLAKAEKDGMVINVSFELPKSFIICEHKKGEQTVYISQLSSSTLLKRSESGMENALI